jgi:hypothetical protein
MWLMPYFDYQHAIRLGVEEVPFEKVCGVGNLAAAIGCGLAFTWCAGHLRSLISVNHQSSALSTLSDLNRFTKLYAEDFDDRLMPASTWMDSLEVHRNLEDELWRFRTLRRADFGSLDLKFMFGTAMFSEVGGKRVSELNPESPLFFESKDPSWNAHGTLEIADDERYPDRHYWVTLVSGAEARFFDGKPAPRK